MITLYSHNKAPNGWKVAIVLEELGLKYETKFLEFDSEPAIKGAEHVKYNPNGRIPTIIDHDNEDFTIWESNSIIKYLVDRYDKNNKISFPPGSKESYLVDQWMTFQVSGRGPYFGQITWFRYRHPEKVPTAIERYQKEAVRVISVLDGVLSNQKYLVGDKLTIADLVWYPWNYLLDTEVNLLQEASDSIKEEFKSYKNFHRWNASLKEVEGVKKAYESRNHAA